MTDATWVAVAIAAIAAVPPTIVAWASLRQSKANGVKTDQVSSKADEIHVLTNSNLAKVQTELATANDRIASLETLIGKLTTAKT